MTEEIAVEIASRRQREISTADEDKNGLKIRVGLTEMTKNKWQRAVVDRGDRGEREITTEGRREFIREIEMEEITIGFEDKGYWGKDYFDIIKKFIPETQE